ncbi:MAG: GNAT family N-acetyltransferase [Arenicellales bacterium]|nr:GNAT family N-acetyltransferase [Arenicellales bacterium]
MISTTQQSDLILQTKRLTVRPFSLGDADFILELLNEKAFIENIGDKQVRSLDDARRYLRDGPIASYHRYGVGLWRVGLQAGGASIGMVGLIKREQLVDVDLGYALLAEYCGKGYALEVTSAVMTYVRERLGYRRVVAVVNKDNEPSVKLLKKLGFEYERMVQLNEEDEEAQLFVSVPESVV